MQTSLCLIVQPNRESSKGYFCYDHNTYDGAPDARPDQHIIGYGDTWEEAILDWMGRRQTYEAKETKANS